MKKHLLLLLVSVFAVSTVKAQRPELYELMYHQMTGFYYGINNTMQQRDGDHIIDINLAEVVGYDEAIPYGRMCYKISPTSSALTITDSLFVADTTLFPTFLARDPRGEGNIRAFFEYHADCDSTFVRISHFPDNDLQANPEEDVVVPICEGMVGVGSYGSLLDCHDDLIMTYYKPRTEETSDQYIARIGLDGTLKLQALLTENISYDFGPLRMLKESPLQYYQWDEADNYPNNHLAVYVIDSLFHRNIVILNKILSLEHVGPNITVYEHLGIGYDTEVIPAGGDDILVAAQYTHDTNFLALTEDCGVAVAKYDLRTMQLKGYAVFNDYHWLTSTGFPIGLKMLEDGTVYFMYKEHGYPDEIIVIVKMDVNLNVEWKRFCKTEGIFLWSPFNSPFVFEDEAGEEKGVAWSGYAVRTDNHNEQGWLYFMLNHDGPVNDLSEFGIEVRPYAYYPNPARNEVHLSYSPDVQPARIELYDLQGRLLQTQTQSLESIGLEGLAVGQYLMKVFLDNGKVFTEKVVKK